MNNYTYTWNNVVKRWNKLMIELCYEYNTIGLDYSQFTEKWNLRDLICEADYILSCYYEDGNYNCEMKYSYDIEERKMWRNETEKLKRFINRYKPFIENMKCTVNHCSKYDNYNG